MRNLCYINHSGKYIEINFNMKIPFPFQKTLLMGIEKYYLALSFI